MHPQLARRCHIHCAAAGDSCVDARDVGVGLRAGGADADNAVLARFAGMGDVDVVAAACQFVARLGNQRPRCPCRSSSSTASDTPAHRCSRR